MPFDYLIDEMSNLAVIHAVGQCDVPSFTRIMETVSADIRFDLDTQILFDTTLGNTPSTDEAFELITAMASLEAFKGRQIAIVTNEHALYGINRMIATLSNLKGTNLKVFIDIAQATKWLDPKIGSESPETDESSN